MGARSGRAAVPRGSGNFLKGGDPKSSYKARPRSSLERVRMAAIELLNFWEGEEDLCAADRRITTTSRGGIDVILKED